MRNENLLDVRDFEGLDGSRNVMQQVLDIGKSLDDEGFVLAGDAVDAGIALAIIDADSHDTLIQHLDYIISQLSLYRANLKRRGDSDVAATHQA